MVNFFLKIMKNTNKNHFLLKNLFIFIIHAYLNYFHHKKTNKQTFYKFFYTFYKNFPLIKIYKKKL